MTKLVRLHFSADSGHCMQEVTSVLCLKCREHSYILKVDPFFFIIKTTFIITLQEFNNAQLGS
jgi:hypothetical protein